MKTQWAEYLAQVAEIKKKKELLWKVATWKTKTEMDLAESSRAVTALLPQKFVRSSSSYYYWT